MHKWSYYVSVFFISLLLSGGLGITAAAQTVQLDQYNSSSGGGGGTALYDNIMRYTITATNETTAPINNSVVYANIPAGTLYVPASTTVNGISVLDVNGKMPFGSGGLINTPTYGPGVLAPGTSVVIVYYAKVIANRGGLTNHALFSATTGSGNVVAKSNTVSTAITTDGACAIIMMSTSQVNTGGPPTYLYRYIKAMNSSTGTASTTLATGTTGSPLADAQAMAYHRTSNRVYFINSSTNNPAQELCYFDRSTGTINKYVGYPLETNTAAGYNVDRMTYGSDGYFYALTTNAQDLIRFTVDVATNLPVISPLGPLVNDVNNGANNVLAETGGDMFGDASGRLFLIPNSGKLYMINPATRVATYVGTISGWPGSATGVAVDGAGDVIVGGAYSFVYRVNLATLSATQINTTTSNVWRTGDYASCALPIMAPVLNATKTYTNINGFDPIRAGDPIEYTIEVTNTGNLFATAAKLFDAIPANSAYIPNSTTVNGIAVADIGGAMPFSVSGGQFINTSGAAAGIVKPGVANKVVIKFRVETAEYKTVCNQATISYPDANDNLIHVFSDDPAQSGEVDPTCLYSGQGLISMSASKTYFNTTTGHIGNITGDPMEYTIVVTNSGLGNASGVKLYDAIPAFGHYIFGTTTMNGMPVADNGASMPFSVSGGAFVNSPGQADGIVAPGDANKVVIKFRITADGLKTVCNQATVYYTGAIGDTKNAITDDPTQGGTQDATCFWSDGIVGSGRVAVTSVPAVMEKIEVKPNPFVNNLNLQVQLNTSEKVQIRLIDFYGRTVYTTSRSVGAGVSSLNLSVPEGLSNGMYVLELSAGGKRLLSKKLIKQ
ncbi:MAG TPA: T9SS type A sorting domain-containing protein [Niastella sp.]